MGAIDRKVFLERFYVIAIITELTGGLYEERDIRLVLGEVIRTADFHQMIEERLIVGRLGRIVLTEVPHCQRANEYSSTQ